MSHLVCLGKLWHHNLRSRFKVLQFHKCNSRMDGLPPAGIFYLTGTVWKWANKWSPILSIVSEYLHRTGQGIRDDQMVYCSQLIRQLNLCFFGNTTLGTETKAAHGFRWSKRRFCYIEAGPKFSDPISFFGQEQKGFDFISYCLKWSKNF